MTRGLPLLAGALLALAACDRGVPDDTAAGVGFGDYGAYQQGRATARAQLSGQPAIGTAATVREPSPATPAGTDPVAARAAAAIAAAEAGSTGPTVPPAAAPATSPANPGISDEQNFDAVAARETIETDAERLERMAAARVEIAPTAVPERPAGTGPNVVEYALATTHPVGQQVHRRSPIGRGRHEANCLSYQSDDLAQQAFLAMGGPERDRQALDPDGDGYACDWDPGVYRSAARGG